MVRISHIVLGVLMGFLFIGLLFNFNILEHDEASELIDSLDVARRDASRVEETPEPTSNLFVDSKKGKFDEVELKGSQGDFRRANVCFLLGGEENCYSLLDYQRPCIRTTHFGEPGEKPKIACLPSILVGGFSKCATSSMFKYLTHHPLIPVSTPKEPKFFSDKYDPENIDEYLKVYTKHEHLDEPGRKPFKLMEIDGSSNTYTTEGGPQRVWRFLPKAKFIVLLRDPIDRFFSFLHMAFICSESREDTSEGHMCQREKIEAFEQRMADDPKFEKKVAVRFNRHVEQAALDHTIAFRRCNLLLSGMSEEDIRALPREVDDLVPGRHYEINSKCVQKNGGSLSDGLYAEHIAEWFKVFPRSQFHFVTTELLGSDTEFQINRVIEWLELPPHDFSDVSKLHFNTRKDLGWAKFNRYDARDKPPDGAVNRDVSAFTKELLVKFYTKPVFELEKLLIMDFPWFHRR